MAPGFEAAFPPDDTGRLTFERFRYQAHVAFRFCLEAATGGSVLGVLCEHFEDIAVERSDGWRSAQIKTRDAELGPWRLSDLLASSGALRGLLRTHRALAGIEGGDRCRLEARLEGAIARGDAAEALTPIGDGVTDDVVRRCAERLGIDEDEARQLLLRVTVFDGEPHREHIRAVNLDLLRRAAPALSGEQVATAYDRVLARIEQAMEGDLLADDYLGVIIRPDTAAEAARRLAAAKRLDRAVIEALFGPLQAPQALLRQISDPAALKATALESKLRFAGATDAIVGDAKTLRANATIRETEIVSSSIADAGPALSDVRTRLRMLGNSAAATVHDDPPAPAIWERMMQRLANEAHAVDPARLFSADPALLLGELCQVSDLCEYEWGISA